MNPGALVIDANDDVLMLDTNAGKIRKITMSSCSAANGWQCAITTIAGNGVPGYNGDNTALSTELNCPYDMTMTPDGTVYFSDVMNCRVRALSTGGAITTLVDLSAATVNCGIDYPELFDECQTDSLDATDPLLGGIASDTTGNVYYFLAHGSSTTIQKNDTHGSDTSVLGGTSGVFGGGDGLSGTQVAVGPTFNMGVSPQGQLILPGSYATSPTSSIGVVRVADFATFTTKTIAGDVDGVTAGALEVSSLTNPQAIIPTANGLGWLVADGKSGQIRRINVSTDFMDVVVGYPQGLADTASPRQARYAALLANAVGLAFDPQTNVLYVSEQDATRLHAITMPDVNDAATWQSQVYVTATAGNPLGGPRGLAFDTVRRLLYVADPDNGVIKSLAVDSGSKNFALVAGRVGHSGFSGEGIAATEAVFNAPEGVAVGPDGDLYIADTKNNRIRRVDASGAVTTVMGDGTPSSGGAGTPASIFQVDQPQSMAFDSFGNMFITSARRRTDDHGSGKGG